MKVALCTRNARNPVIALLERTLGQAGAAAAVITDARQLTVDQAWDVAFWRPDSATREIAAFAREAPVILDATGVPFLNSLASMDRAGSKLVSHALFRRCGLDVPAAVPAPAPGAAPGPEIADLSGPVIVKPIWGKKARLVQAFDDVGAALAAAAQYGEPSLIQAAIPWRCQYRCVVDAAGGAVRVYRDENPAPGTAAVRTFDRFDARPVKASPEVEQLARAMLEAVGGDLMRADVLEDADGRLWALEVNASFGFPHDDTSVLDAFVSGFRRLARQGAAQRSS